MGRKAPEVDASLLGVADGIFVDAIWGQGPTEVAVEVVPGRPE